MEAARAELNQKQAALQTAEAKLEMLSVRESNLSQHISVLQESIKSKKEENSLLQADVRYFLVCFNKFVIKPVT